MKIASYLIELAPGGLISRTVVLVALGAWLVLISGLAGRVALLVEELPHWWTDLRGADVIDDPVPVQRRIEIAAPVRLAA